MYLPPSYADSVGPFIKTFQLSQLYSEETKMLIHMLQYVMKLLNTNLDQLYKRITDKSYMVAVVHVGSDTFC